MSPLGDIRNYTEEAVRVVVEDILLHKTPYKMATRKFNVSKVTLQYKVEGKYPIKRSSLSVDAFQIIG